MEQSRTIQKKQPAILEKALTISVLFLSTGAFIPLLQYEKWMAVSSIKGDILPQTLWLGFFALTSFLFLKIIRRAAAAVFQEKFILLLLLAVFSSICWSETPAVTVQRSVIFLSTTVFGIYLAARYDIEELLTLLLATLCLSALFSVIFVYFLPSYAVHQNWNGTPWRGIYLNRNTLGYLMALASLVSLLYCCNCMRKCIAPGSFFCLFLLLMFKSRSMTAITVFLVLLPVFLTLILMRLGRKRAAVFLFLFFLSVASASAVFFAIYPETVFMALGRDPTLTGRTFLWRTVWEMIIQQPWLGYGYGAFRPGWTNSSHTVLNLLPGVPFYAHNGYLDLLLQLGSTGLALFILSFLTAFYRAVYLIRTGPGVSLAFPLLFLVFLLVYNLSENLLLQNSFLWIIYVVTSYRLHINSIRKKAAK